MIACSAGNHAQGVALAAQKNGMQADKIISEINPAASEECARKLASVLKEGDVLLVKASRGMAAEKVIKFLKEHGIKA